MTFTPLASSSHGSAYTVSDNASGVLLECGPPLRKPQKALECSYDDGMLSRASRLPEKVRRIRNSHMEMGRVCTYLEKLDRSLPRTIYLLHLSDARSDSGLFQDLAERVRPGVEVIICQRG